MAKDYNCKGDGSTDNTGCINAALADAYTANGATLYFPGHGPYVFSSQITLPNNGGGGVTAIQPSIRITCDGAGGLWNDGVAGIDTVAQRGTVLQFNYVGPGGGQIQTLAFGSLEIDHCTLYSPNSATRKSVSAATNTSPVKLTVSTHGLADGDTVSFTGATGSWVPLNRSFAVTVVDADNITVPLDSSAFSTLTGTVLEDATPSILYTTKTTLKIHDCQFNGVVGIQDAITLGGTLGGDDHLLVDINEAFGGWGTYIVDNLVHGRRSLYLRSVASAIAVEGNTFWGQNGLHNGAVIEIDTGLGTTSADVFVNNLIEIPGTNSAGVYVNTGNGNTFIGNGVWDNASLPSILISTNSSGNLIVNSDVGQGTPSDSLGQSTIINSAYGGTAVGSRLWYLQLTSKLGGYSNCTHGTNATCGVAALSSGTATITTTAAHNLAADGTAGYAIVLSEQVCSGTCAGVWVGSVSNGTSFTINGAATDNSTVFWEIRYVN